MVRIEDDFQEQQSHALVECPVCGNTAIIKMLSAPRLNFGGVRETADPTHDVASPIGSTTSLQAASMEVARLVVANADDVGDQFAEEA